MWVLQELNPVWMDVCEVRAQKIFQGPQALMVGIEHLTLGHNSASGPEDSEVAPLEDDVFSGTKM